MTYQPRNGAVSAPSFFWGHDQQHIQTEQKMGPEIGGGCWPDRLSSSTFANLHCK